MSKPLIIRTETPEQRDAVIDTIKALAPHYRGIVMGDIDEFKRYWPCWSLNINRVGGMTYSSEYDERGATPWAELTIPELRAALGLDKPAEPASWPGPPLCDGGADHPTAIFRNGDVQLGDDFYTFDSFRAFIAAYQQRTAASQPAREHRLATPLHINAEGDAAWDDSGRMVVDASDYEGWDDHDRRGLRELAEHYNATTKGK